MSQCYQNVFLSFLPSLLASKVRGERQSCVEEMCSVHTYTNDTFRFQSVESTIVCVHVLDTKILDMTLMLVKVVCL